MSGRERHAGAWVILDLLLAVALVWLVLPVVSRAYERKQSKRELALVGREAHDLYDALCAYFDRDEGFRPDGADRFVDLRSLRPLRQRGYYRGPINDHLLDSRADAFDAPIGPDATQHFWLEMTLARDPSIRILVSRSDRAPMAGGRWRDGVFVHRDGRLERL